MPQYLAPGVYVEEVASGARPIAGAGTSTAGFIGVVGNDVTMPVRPGLPLAGQAITDDDRYPLAPAGEPQLITSWEAFKNTFGDFSATANDGTTHVVNNNNTLAHAVYGFFLNGGTRCWVARIAPNGDAGTLTTEATNALATFAAIDEIALVAVPGAQSADVQDAVLDHCESVQDRFAILDGQRTPASATTDLIKGTTRRSSYGAIYYPWIQVFDPATNASLIVPPSGHLAGVYARVDATRGVHKAPANETIMGATGVEARLSKADQAGLNPDGINVIRDFDGTIKPYGARTLEIEDTEWKYISVRRLFLFLRDSIDQGTQWVVFEPNTPSLWAQITRNVTAFLTTVWRGGALFGATPADAFYVRCDESTNPPELRDLGQVVTEVGVRIVDPAEFVIFRIAQWAGPAG